MADVSGPGNVDQVGKCWLPVLLPQSFVSPEGNRALKGRDIANPVESVIAAEAGRSRAPDQPVERAPLGDDRIERGKASSAERIGGAKERRCVDDELYPR